MTSRNRRRELLAGSRDHALICSVAAALTAAAAADSLTLRPATSVPAVAVAPAAAGATPTTAPSPGSAPAGAAAPGASANSAASAGSPLAMASTPRLLTDAQGEAIPASVALPVTPPEGEAPQAGIVRTSSSLLCSALLRPGVYAKQPVKAGTIEAMSLFAVRSPEERHFSRHDLVQIVVQEKSSALSDSKLDTKKNYKLDAEVGWGDFNFSALGSTGTNLSATKRNSPVVEVIGNKKLLGEGDYTRKDEFTTRLTAEVIEVLPNGNLILEARTTIKNDKECSSIKLTGVCRPEDITAANTVLSNQVHDLTISKQNTGFVKDAADKGIIAQILDAVLAF